MDDALAALASQIATASGLSVAIGHPGSAKGQLVIWPWHITSVKTLRNHLPHEGRSAPEPPMALSFILLAQGQLKVLQLASRCISQHSLLIIDSAQYKVQEQDLSQELHISLLRAAAIPPQPVLGYVLVG